MFFSAGPEDPWKCVTEASAICKPGTVLETFETEAECRFQVPSDCGEGEYFFYLDDEDDTLPVCIAEALAICADGMLLEADDPLDAYCRYEDYEDCAEGDYFF